MKDFYYLKIIPKILKAFKIKNIVVSGVTDTNLMDNILKYDATFTQINTKEVNCIKGNPLNVLNNLKNYDAIFIDDDSNWYTVFNELRIIKKTNEDFPLVFICNNIFPNKRRDSYSNPEVIPADFRQRCRKELPVYYNNEKIVISDGFFHACEENTPRNGVLTAIEDFLNENSYIGMMKINFIKEISILYPRTQVNQKRISAIYSNILDDKIKEINFSDKLIENQLLISYIGENNLHDDNLIDLKEELSKKDVIMRDYEDKIRAQNNKIAFKDSQLSGVQSNLSLKDSQIKNIESKLVNKDMKINKLTEDIQQKEYEYKNQIHSLNHEINKKDQNLINIENKYAELIKIKDNEINFFKKDIQQKESEYADQIYLLNHELSKKNQNLINTENKIINQKDAQIKTQQQELDEKQMMLNYLQNSYTKQLSKIDNNEYCISCYKDEISNNHLAIKYLRKQNLIKKILSPISYIYLIFKSNLNEISLNIKLYDVLKGSNCFDIGFYLNNNRDLIESKWCKYFSPELHYVCKGFEEGRLFNKKYFNRKSKKDLLEYLLTCGER